MSIAIVGGGIGGLVSAILLADNGYQVTLFEKEAKLGGRLTFETNGDYTIDQGPTIVLLPQLLIELLKACGLKETDIELVRCDPLYDIHYSDGSTYRKWQQEDQQVNELKHLFPDQVQGFRRYLADMGNIYQFGTEAFLSRTFALKRDFLSFKNIKFVLASKSYRTVSNYLAEYFDSLKLQHAYALQTLYIGGAPHTVPALYGLISYSEHAFGIWYVKGGYYSLIPKLEELALEKGVNFFKKTAVTEIIVEEKRVEGVRTSKGDFQFGKVIFNGDYPLINRLLKKEKNRGKAKYVPSSGCVLVYIGVKHRYLNTLTHQYFLSRDFDFYMKHVSESTDLPADPSCYVFNPITIDPESAPAGKSTLYLLIPVPARLRCSEQELDHFVDEQVNRIEQAQFPNLKQQIEWQTIRTPRDAEKEGLYGGGSFGVAPLLNQSGAFRPQFKHPIVKGLYAVGASVHPGGGVPIVMQGARLLVNEIIKGE
ncbi:phytoene desaturase [Amphibacillus marinus]|uniref:Phytoene desaturase n=1 Tax=Amphibacillus marinus TaxID=872970 RepID=A0A1H8K2P1_9BACI|nr:phytoene desaturase family protein [Amphibacillus marinus]SEN87212.1 phytoene desaturase [Amphibacillus marinus]